MKFRKMVRKRALVVILAITMICQGIVPAYADTPDKHSESENVVIDGISEEDSPVEDEIVLASPDNAAYDSGKNEDITIEEVYEEDPLSADGLILGASINEEDDRLIIGSEGTVLRVPDNPKDIELVYSFEDDTYIGSTYSTEIDNEYSDKSIFVQLTLTPLDPQQIAFGSREQKVKIPLSDMLELDDRIYFSIEASNEMKLTNSEVKDNWEVELSLLISDDENTELEDLTDGEMFHREGYAQSGDDAFAFADSVLFTVENIKHTSFDPYSLLVVMAPQNTWWKSENYHRSDIDEIIFGQTPTADIKETWNADADNYGFIKCFITETTGDDRSYRTLYIARTVGNSSEIVANEDSSYMFGACGALGDGTYDAFDNLRELEISHLNTANVENMNNMFYSCRKLERLDLSNFDTTHVTDMSEMFSHCESLEVLNLDSFDTANVTTMSRMFSSCKSLKELDLSGFDTGNVTLMSYMFDECTNLETIDLTGFDTSNVTSMWFMFDYCESLKTIYSNDFDIGKVELGSPMFLYCSNLVGEKGTVYKLEYGIPEYAHVDGGESNPGYFTSKNTEQEESLEYTVTFDSNGHGVAPANRQIAAGGKIEKPADPISEGYTFEGWYKESSCENIWDFDTDFIDRDRTLYAKWRKQGTITSGFSGTCEWYFSENTDGGNTLTIKPISGEEGILGFWEGFAPWNQLQLYDYKVETRNIKIEGKVNAQTCESMFNGFVNITELDLSNLYTDNVTDMSSMFAYCRRLKDLDLGNLNTSSVRSMAGMFDECFEIDKLDLSGFDTGNVLYMDSMFSSCSALTRLDLSNFETRNTKDMSYMFNGVGLTELNLSNFNTDNVEQMDGMFRWCSSLESVVLGSFNTSNVVNMSQMFLHCEKLKEIDVSSFDTSKVSSFEYMFASCTNLNTIYASDKFTTTNNTLYYPKIFVDSVNICGGQGTKWENLNIEDRMKYGKDGEYARIDEGPAKPGLFTDINAIEDSELKIIKFISPSGDYVVRTKYDLKCYAFEVDPDMSEMSINLEVTEGAEWKLYSDAVCKNELNKNDKVSLSDDTNYFYVKVYKDSESAVYAIELTKEQSELPYSESKELIYRDGTKTTITWGSSLFDCSATTYNKNLALAGLYLAEAAEATEIDEIEEKMKHLGFKELWFNPGEINFPATAIGYTAYNGTFGDHGIKYLVCVTVRGTTDFLDIISDINSQQDGFKDSGKNIYNTVKRYLAAVCPKANADNTVFFINGHSLGGATAGELTYFIDVDYYKNQTFTYTFASPQFNRNNKASSEYPNIFNMINDNDVIPVMPHGYSRLGVKRLYSTPFNFVTQAYKPGTDFMTGSIRSGTLLGGIASLAGLFSGGGAAIISLMSGGEALKEHSTSTYLELLMNHDPISVEYEDSAEINYYSAHCPVDVKIINSDGVVIAESKGDKAYNYGVGDVLLFTQDDAKHIIQTGNREYKFEFTGTDTGEMSYTALKLDNATDQILQENEFKNIALEDGKKLLSNTQNDLDSLSLFVTDNEGNLIKEVNENGTETPLSATYTVSFSSNGHGTAPDSQQISAGGRVSKPADPAASGYTFGGWYTESSCINQWNFSTGVVNSNITLFAKWTGNANGIIPSGGNTGSGGSGRSSGGSGGSGGGGGSISKAKTATGATYSPNWFVDASGVWKIRNSKGEIIKNAWLCDDVITANGQNVWYLLQADGSMLSAGLVQDNTGNFYSLETTHNGYFGMMRYKDGYYDCNGQQVYLKFNQKHDNSFGAVINEDGLEKLKQIYGITKYPIGNETCTYTSTF